MQRTGSFLFSFFLAHKKNTLQSRVIFQKLRSSSNFWIWTQENCAHVSSIICSTSNDSKEDLPFPDSWGVNSQVKCCTLFSNMSCVNDTVSLFFLQGHVLLYYMVEHFSARIIGTLYQHFRLFLIFCVLLIHTSFKEGGVHIHNVCSLGF